MKRLSSILSAAILLVAAIPTATAVVQVSVDYFHDNLEPFGDWREVGDYGYCWQPRDVGDDWRPYRDGCWLYTDAGWTWDSEEPYSWAVYHYGRWARIDRIGWVWVPGTEWGPAWVSWRRSPQHIGWAPLPPEAVFSRNVGFSARVDADYDIGPANYSFVGVRNFGVPQLRTVIVNRRENITIINQTTNITQITYVNNVVYNQGPQYEVISRESIHPIRRLKLDRREDLDSAARTVGGERLKTRVDGDAFRVLAPAFNNTPATAPRKVTTKVEKAEVDRGWKDAGPPAEVAKVRARIKAEPAMAPKPDPQAKREKVAAAPPGLPAPLTPPDKRSAKENAGGRSTPLPAAGPVTEAPIEPRRIADKPARPGEVVKPVTPGATATSPLPTPEPPSREGRAGKVSEAALPPKEAPSAPRVPDRKPKIEGVVPKHDAPPAATEALEPRVHSEKVESRPKPEQPAVRNVDRPTAPAVKPQTPPAATGKGEAEEKDEKKNGANQ